MYCIVIRQNEDESVEIKSWFREASRIATKKAKGKIHTGHETLLVESGKKTRNTRK